LKKNKISKNWVNKQRRDTYVRQSKVDGYRARSAYKLKEIDEKFKIFKGGMSVVDIGAAPGSWSQYVAKVVKSGEIISIDLKEMENIENTLQIQGDFTLVDTQNQIKEYLKKKPEIKSCHNIEWEDNYSWIHQKNILEVLKDKSKLDPEVKKYLEEENTYTDHHLKDTKKIQKILFDEIKGTTHKYF